MTSILTSKPVGMPTPLMSDDALYEVVNGQRVELPPMSIYAVWIGSRLQARLAPFAEAKKLGTVVTEALFILDAANDLRRRPDVAFVSTERWPLDRATCCRAGNCPLPTCFNR